MKKYFQLTFVLLIIASLSGLILGLTNEVTKGPIHTVALKKINDNMVAWFPTVPNNLEENATADHPEVNQANNPLYDKNVNNIYDAKDADGNLVGYVFEVKAAGSYGGGMVLLVGVDTSGKVVGYTYQQFNESGPGANVKYSQTFIDSILGQTQVMDENSNFTVDTVSGATFTSSATLRGVNVALTYFDQNFKE